ncbi:MAG: ABC transporter permease [Lachnospiraceae bacterium]|nr:ABC transporter permease [Lachnospiraceae bacterium]
MIKKITGFKEIGVIVPLAVLIIIFSCTSDIFLTTNNLLNITRQISIKGLLGIAMTFVIITGGIDLSVGSVIAFSSILTASAIKDYQLPVLAAVVIGIAVGTLTGLVNGILIAYVNMPAFITTMGTMTILRGLGYIYTQGYPIYDLPQGFRAIGQGNIGIIPVSAVILVVVAILAFMILSKTVFGRHIYAVGGNIEAARMAGIRVKRVQLYVYMISGFISGIAAVVQGARVGSGLPTIGQGFEMDAIASVVIGGAAMAGGSGTILGTLLGSLILGVLDNGLSLLNVDSYVMNVISGVVVILAVLIDQVRVLMKQNSQIKETKAELKAEK